MTNKEDSMSLLDLMKHGMHPVDVDNFDKKYLERVQHLTHKSDGQLKI